MYPHLNIKQMSISQQQMGGFQFSLISQKHRQHAQKQCNTRGDLLTLHTKNLFEQTHAE